ncbi:MAG: hypothetical protein ABI912_03775 [Actinomycetota bacterium]
MEELACLLGRERLLLERLLFKLIELRALLQAGEARFLPWAAGEVDHATARLREAELHRALMINKLAVEAGMDGSALSLQMLARTTPEPYAGIFSDQRRAFRALTKELHDCVATCTTIAGDGESYVTDILDRVVVDADGALARTSSNAPGRNPLVVKF